MELIKLYGIKKFDWREKEFFSKKITDISINNKKSKYSWISVSRGFFYMNYDEGRIYYILSKLKQNYPEFMFDDNLKKIFINDFDFNYEIKIESNISYNIIKEIYYFYKK